MDCPFCRYANPEDTNFCDECGSPLSLQGETAVGTPDTKRAFLQDIQPPGVALAWAGVSTEPARRGWKN